MANSLPLTLLKPNNKTLFLFQELLEGVIELDKNINLEYQWFIIIFLK